jgi:hypothetical protein
MHDTLNLRLFYAWYAWYYLYTHDLRCIKHIYAGFKWILLRFTRFTHNIRRYLSFYAHFTQNIRKIYAKYAHFKQGIQPMCVFFFVKQLHAWCTENTHRAVCWCQWEQDQGRRDLEATQRGSSSCCCQRQHGGGGAQWITGRDIWVLSDIIFNIIPFVYTWYHMWYWSMISSNKY